MKIAIRMDDISPRMDYARWERAERILAERGIAPLLGVVPDNRDANLNRGDKPEDEETFWAFLRECREKGYTLALHGCYHVYDTDKGGMFPLNTFSEFAGHSFEKQLERLSYGKKILDEHGIQTELFMAPAHSYDRNTLKALKSIGITKLTDGFGARPYVYRGMTFYPIAYHLEKQWDKPGYTTLVLHTNTMEEKDFERLARIVSQREVISYGEYLQAEPRQAGAGHRLWEYGMATAKRVLVRVRSGRRR